MLIEVRVYEFKMVILLYFLHPLQTSNCTKTMIFLYQKVYVLHGCDEDMPLVKAIGIIVLRPQDMAEAKPISNLNAGIDE